MIGRKYDMKSIFKNVIFVVGCLALVVSSLLIMKDIAFMMNAEQVDCEIVEIEKYHSGTTSHHNVYVSYTYDGKLYDKVYLRTYVAGMYEGKNIKIYCNPDNPEEISLGVAEFSVYFLPIVFGIIAICIGIFKIHKVKKIDQLSEIGEVIYAVVDGFERDSKHSHSGMNSYIIVCSYKDTETGKIYSFMRGELVKSQCEMYQPGDTVKVLVLPEDYEHYQIVL